MNLLNKKKLAARTLGVGKERVVFSNSRLNDIKEAITKQDIKDLHADGAIKIKEISGRKKIVRRKRKTPGKIKKRINKRKEDYVKLTRKLRDYVKKMLVQGKISKDNYKDLRKKIRNKMYRSKAHLKDSLEGKK